MFHKKFYVAIAAFLLILNNVHGKRTRKINRTKPEDDISTPQPSVVSYSTFGFNDVGKYEGFVPSSPDYTKLLGGGSQENSPKDDPTRFPTSPGSNDFGHAVRSQSYNGQSFSVNSNGESTINLGPHSSMYFHSPSFDANNDPNRNTATEEIYSQHTEDKSAPIYGTKINSKNRNRSVNSYNYTQYHGPSGVENEDKYLNYNEAKQVFENRPSAAESSDSFLSAQNYPSSNAADFSKPINDPQNLLNFPRVVDFTQFKQYYPSELDTSNIPSGTPTPDVYENNESKQNNYFTSKFNVHNQEDKHLFTPATKQKDFYEDSSQEKNKLKSNFKFNNIKDDSYNFSTYEGQNDNSLFLNSEIENKKKLKHKPWSPDSQYFKKWKEPASSSAKGYEYSTNFSTMNFKYEADQNKISKPLGSIDEIIPASSNIELPSFQFPENKFYGFKKLPEYKVHEEEDEFSNFVPYKEKTKPKQNDFDYNQYKYLFNPAPTTSSYFGNNIFKSSEYSSAPLKTPTNKYRYRDNDEVVNIPRRPNKISYEKPFESKPIEWAQYNRRPYKNSPYKDWPIESSYTRFKSEEDLLGLRNQDTTHPSYVPSFRPNHFDSEDIDYKKFVEKWRQSYWKSKIKDSTRDYEGYGSETKTAHVPVPKPYPIEVPHPIIVPVPQPYPVRVPIAKPVAVPVVRELMVPVEKPMPYLIYKDVPFPIEKLVPVPVEKEVPVPVVKPYPVHIPYIKPVFHHTKSREEYDSDHSDDDDYFPRHESNLKSSRYKKKIPNSSRNRPRRPSRTAYQDRNRRRWPERRHPADRDENSSRMRPMHPAPFKRHDVEPPRFSHKPSLCKRPGDC